MAENFTHVLLTIHKTLRTQNVRVRPREQFLDPVRLRPLAFLGRAVRLGQARGPSAAAREKNLTKFIFTSSLINTLKIDYYVQN